MAGQAPVSYTHLDVYKRQHALLTTAHATLPRRGWAWERFTPEGPLALLPHPQTPDAYSVVWCSAPDRAAELRCV